MTTKIDLIKAHLKSGRDLTQLEAIGLYGAYRLAARIKELRNAGWDIETDIRRDPRGSVYATYKLVTKEPTADGLSLPERYRAEVAA